MVSAWRWKRLRLLGSAPFSAYLGLAWKNAAERFNPRLRPIAPPPASKVPGSPLNTTAQAGYAAYAVRRRGNYDHVRFGA